MGFEEEEGVTIDSKLNSIKHNNFSALSPYKVIIVDEMSMVKELHWCALYNWLQADPTICAIFVGNWVQWKPVMDRAWFNYEHSFAINQMCGGNLLDLNKYRRGDIALFNTFKDIKETHEIDRSKFGTKEQDLAICFLNSTVKRLNKKWMEHYKPKNRDDWITAVSSQLAKKNRHTQNIIVYKGLPVMACITRKAYLLTNCTTWNVKSFSASGVILKSDDSHKCEKTTPRIPLNEFADLVRPAYAFTTHKSQGITIRRPYVIHDWKKMSWRGQYVAVSRGTKLKDVNIISKAEEELAEKKKKHNSGRAQREEDEPKKRTSSKRAN